MTILKNRLNGDVKVDDALSVMKMRRKQVLGICTTDFSFLHDMTRILGEAVDRFYILKGGKRTENRLDCLMLEEGAAPPLMRPPPPPVVVTLDDPWVTFERAVAAAMGRLAPESLVIGIDPGKRPGIAFLADGRVISTFRAAGPAETFKIVRKGKRAYQGRYNLIRIGDGDPKSRDALIEKLKVLNVPVEVVNEEFTSKGTRRRDENAAINIARTSGPPL